jgi:hypothetical protein
VVVGPRANNHNNAGSIRPRDATKANMVTAATHRSAARARARARRGAAAAAAAAAAAPPPHGARRAAAAAAAAARGGGAAAAAASRSAHSTAMQLATTIASCGHC